MSSANVDIELLTEHFGYPPVSLLDDIINSVNIYAERALNSVEQALLRLPPTSLGFNPAHFQNKGAGAEKLSQDALEAAAEEAHHHEVENGTHQLETLLCASIDRNFDKFEIYAMRNILCVKPEDRDWLRLAHYEGLEFALDAPADGDLEKEDDDSDASIAHLHRRLQASLKLGHLLDVESQQNETMLRRLRSAAGTGAKPGSSLPQEPQSLSSLAFLLNRGPLTESDAAAPLTTTTAFALSQLPSLRQLSAELRHKAPGLAAAAAADNDDADVNEGGAAGEGGRANSRSKSWRRERVEYVESSARKHLERVRGLSLGRNGETQAEIATSSQGVDGSGGITVEPEALKNILNILRDTHGSTPATAAEDAPQQDGDTMDES